MADSKLRPVGMPGWVKVFIGIGIALLVIGGVAAFSGHGPWQHAGMSGMHQ